MTTVDPQQTAAFSFFAPLASAWGIVFAGLEVARRRWPAVWPAASAARSARPRLDLAVAVAVVLAILGLGQLWHAGALRWRWPGAFGDLAYLLAQLVVWAPLPLAMWLRRQPAATAWTGAGRLPLRLVTGLVLGAAGVAVYCAFRGELARLPRVFQQTWSTHSLAHFVPVYLEGVGLAFLFVRLEWALGTTAAALVPALLFAGAHVPRAVAGGESTASILAFFTFNTVLVTVLLLLVRRHRDVAAIGTAHWLLDIAIDAF